ncbi:MAG: tetratricopeptide repeat protein [Verrucomicrobiota bacterium]|nr:tetratricopeptide repeat protein [Verrucomicrobiota bacterium]
MQNPENGNRFVQRTLPWLIAAGILVLYLITLNRWVNIRSLSVVAKVSGWDWTTPAQWPLFFGITYPLRFLPQAWQPVLLNLFSAICAAGAIGLLARSVALLPHDRTHEQRVRERSEYSLLSIPFAWVPPLLATLVCALELSMWEHSTTVTGESLDLLIFAYLIRSLLEYRIDHKNGWLYRFAFIYGLGVTNNWALISFFPAFLVAFFWIKGLSAFKFSFLSRILGCGILGLSLYLLLPLVWMIKGNSDYSFGDVLKANLVQQKLLIFDVSALRSRVLLLSLTSILPVLIIGIRWPSSFGDTSAAGASLTNIMFRVIHILFFLACLFVAFNQKFSPRELGYGLPFLTFYYLGALAIGYVSGYMLLVFTDPPRKSWRQQNPLLKLINPLVRGLVLLALVAVPAALLYLNFPKIRANDGHFLKAFAKSMRDRLPEQGAVLLSEDPYQILLLQGEMTTSGLARKHLLVNTRSLEYPTYHDELKKQYPDRWPDLGASYELGARINHLTLQRMISELARTNLVYYLHPSYGYFFEKVYLLPNGTIYKVENFPTNTALLPPLPPDVMEQNKTFWSNLEPDLDRIVKAPKTVSDSAYVAAYYSRALNTWGIEVQRTSQIKEAGEVFRQALNLNTNNYAAYINHEFNKSLQSGERVSTEVSRTVEDLFGKHRSWNTLLAENGLFDEPNFCFRLGQTLQQQALFRQAAYQFNRTRKLDPQRTDAAIELASSLVAARFPNESLQILNDLETTGRIGPSNKVDVVSIRASALFAQGNRSGAEEVLQRASQEMPTQNGLKDALFELYRSTSELEKALSLLDRRLASGTNAALLLQKADLLIQKGDYSTANATLDQLLQIAPGVSQAVIYKVFVAKQNKDYKTGLELVEQILEQDPKHIQALTYKGIIQMETQEFQKARETFNEILDIEEGSISALHNRAIVNLKLDRLEDAEKDYTLLQKNVPTEPTIYYGLGEIAYRQKNMADAIRFFSLYMKYAEKDKTGILEEEKKQVLTRLQELQAGTK